MENTKEEIIKLYEENAMLKELINNLKKSNKGLEDKLIKCPVTGMFNYDYFRNFLSSEINSIISNGYKENPALIIIGFDNMSKIMYSYGDIEVERVLKNTVYILESLKSDNEVIFRLQGAMFIYYVPNTKKEKIIEIAEKIRVSIELSKKFIERVTVSIGVVCLDEIINEEAITGEPDKLMYNIALMRLKAAKRKGMNMVSSNSEGDGELLEQVTILLVDTDEINNSVLSTFLENLKYQVIVARDGEEALKIVEGNQIALIASEIMIPKIDGFIVREQLLLKSGTKDIPFIIMSHRKDSDSVKRAANLGIENYFKKPIMISEFLGIVKNKVRGSQING